MNENNFVQNEIIKNENENVTWEFDVKSDDIFPLDIEEKQENDNEEQKKNKKNDKEYNQIITSEKTLSDKMNNVKTLEARINNLIYENIKFNSLLTEDLMNHLRERIEKEEAFISLFDKYKLKSSEYLVEFTIPIGNCLTHLTKRRKEND